MVFPGFAAKVLVKQAPLYANLFLSFWGRNCEKDSEGGSLLTTLPGPPEALFFFKKKKKKAGGGGGGKVKKRGAGFPDSCMSDCLNSSGKNLRGR